ncbi:iron ABC transporter permease [Polynucleobacter sp. MWH-Spelu-300-X4]|uniref:FecCD family ABC transporter permease n=1 Tax=Polynucleobacter sp. MWH-Spelu-300-X4 TaxID=2689109 RepID=UPI001BFE3988|nr:iron ABC transporter permease [Polynucleobacter sp. MWH-Spelu-300-X4]QWD80163.1 iron ABC transporter permease [Polynucleobacter sp. MWH-Spelu-300-X4]
MKKPSLFLGLIFLAMLSIAGALLIGSVANADFSLIYQLRLPRVLAAFAVGGLLAMSGCLLQVLTRNPLAESSVLGVSGGASVGALAVLMMGGAGTIWVAGGAWLGAVSVLVLLWLLVGGYATHPSRLLLAGVMVATGCGAITSLMIAFASDLAMPGMIHWLMGDLDSVMSLEVVGALLGIWLSVLLILMKLAPKIHLLQLGTDKALSLGVDVPFIQWMMVLLAALCAAAAVSVAGSIGFVGLLVPHMLRAMVIKRLGPDQTFLLPASGLLGGIFLVLSDMVARTVIAPSQLPVGVITALIGVPSFLFLLARLRQWSSL